MSNDLMSGIDDDAVLATSLTLPYTLTTGASAGAFLAEIGRGRLLGSPCAACERVTVPPREHCPACSEPTPTFVHVPDIGTVTAVTRTDAGGMALIRLDGVGCDLAHRVSTDPLPARGARVRARWAAEPAQSISAIELFEVLEGDDEGVVGDAVEVAEPVTEQAYSLSLRYEHAYGPYYGRMFDELAARRRIVGSTCPRCTSVLVPPRELCDVCFTRTGQIVDVADTGRLQAFSVIHMEFVGQTRTPPYVYAEIVLDGSATRLIHTVGGFDVLTAAERLRVGMPVRAVWKEGSAPLGTLDDIDYFTPVDDEEQA